MESVVNSLLASKKQIDMLKNERATLIHIYENKIDEQNDLIKYLQDENLRLKQALNLKASNQTNCNCEAEHRNWRKKYEVFLENIMRQLLNALKIQENIRIEYFKLEKSQFKLYNSISNHTSIKNESSNDSRNDCKSPFKGNKANTDSFCTSNSWTFNNHSNTTSTHNDTLDLDVNYTNSDYLCQQQANFDTIARFQDLLVQQQKQQLSLLNELSEISTNLKAKANEPSAKQISKPELLIATTSPVSKPSCTARAKKELDNKENVLIGDDNAQRNHNANHSDVNSTTNSQQKNSASTPKKKTSAPLAEPKLDTSQSNLNNKPSKIPKFKKPNGISCSSNETKSNGSLANSNEAEIGTKSTRFKYLSTASKIPQRQTHQSQSSNSQLNTSTRSETNSTNSNPNYNTYVKKSKTQKSTTPIVNSATFDKTKTTTTNATNTPKQTKSSAPTSKPATTSRNASNKSETKLISTKNIEIVVVPAAKLNKTKPNSQKSIPAGGNQVVVKLKDDEGYSTMSSELMQQLKLNTNTKIELCPSIATNSCTSTSSSTNNESHDKNDDSGIRISRVSGDSSNITSDESARTSSSSNHSPRLEAHTILNDSIQSSTYSTRKPASSRRIKKRYCFPTLKSFSYYYNNRFYHHYQKIAEKSSENNVSNVCCKYLSESDVSSLANQLSSYDKDLSYNVYHLDTLYNNVDYILFNSYASDTELVYNYNRRHGRNQHFLNSNYKLYINDYFNQPYDEEELEEDEDEAEISQQTTNTEIQVYDESSSSDERKQRVLLADYELRDDEEYQFEIEDDNFKASSFEYNDEYDPYRQYEQFENYDNYDELEDENVIEMSVDEHEYDDGLLYDDEDVNLLMMMKQTAPNEYQNEIYANECRKNKSESKPKRYVETMSSPLFSSESFNSETCSSSSTCSTCSSRSSTSSSASDLSADSINEAVKIQRVKKIKPKVSNGRIDNPSYIRHHHKHNRKHRRQHRQHDYFCDSIDKYYESSYDKYYENEDGYNENFDMEDFVQQLNMQCNVNEELLKTQRSSKRLKELNERAAMAVTAAAAAQAESSELDESFIIMTKPNIVRRHTFNTMPTSSISYSESKTNHLAESPCKNVDSKAYVGSFNSPSHKNSQIEEEAKFPYAPQRRASMQQTSTSEYKKISNNSNSLQMNNDMSSYANFSYVDNRNLIDLSPCKFNNNFNTDFYKLCSDTFLCGSESNLNNSASVQQQLHLIQQKLQPQIKSPVKEQSNLSNHVNSLFDQWLLNSNISAGKTGVVADSGDC